jgi:hypothetical protein
VVVAEVPEDVVDVVGNDVPEVVDVVWSWLVLVVVSGTDVVLVAVDVVVVRGGPVTGVVVVTTGGVVVGVVTTSSRGPT